VGAAVRVKAGDRIWYKEVKLVNTKEQMDTYVYERSQDSYHHGEMFLVIDTEPTRYVNMQLHAGVSYIDEVDVGAMHAASIPHCLQERLRCCGSWESQDLEFGGTFKEFQDERLDLGPLHVTVNDVEWHREVNILDCDHLQLGERNVVECRKRFGWVRKGKQIDI